MVPFLASGFDQKRFQNLLSNSITALGMYFKSSKYLKYLPRKALASLAPPV